MPHNLCDAKLIIRIWRFIFILLFRHNIWNLVVTDGVQPIVSNFIFITVNKNKCSVFIEVSFFVFVVKVEGCYPLSILFSLRVKGKNLIMLLTKTTAVQNEVTLSYHRVCGLYFLAVIFASTIAICNGQLRLYTCVKPNSFTQEHQKQ